MSTTVTTRLDPDIFRLPVQRIRDGVLLRRVLRAHQAAARGRGRAPAGDDAGLSEARLDPGRHRRGRSQSSSSAPANYEGERWIPGWDDLVVHALPRGRPHLPARDGDDDRGATIRCSPTWRPSTSARWPAARWSCATSRRWWRPPAASRSFYFPARHDHWLVQTGDGYSAHVAGAIGVSTDAQASWWGGRGIGTVPHGLIAAYGGDTVRAARHFSKRFHADMNVTVLVDFENDSVRTRARGRRGARGRALGGAPGYLRAARRPLPVRRDGAASRRPGSTRAWSRRSAARSTGPASRTSRSWPAGGFTADRIRAFEAASIPVDAYGVGSSLIRGQNDFTADVVLLDGQPCAKVGRHYVPNPRLRRVQ